MQEKYNATINEEAADILRILLMQKTGGSYWDSDTISMQKFPTERCSNWLHHQDYYFDTYAMNFEPDHPYFRVAIESMVGQIEENVLYDDSL